MTAGKEKDILQDLLEQILQHYAENYEINYQPEIGDGDGRALAEYHIMTEKTMFGVKMKLGSTEANESVLFVCEESFTLQVLAKLKKLCESLEQKCLNMHKQHAYSMFSVVLIAKEVDKEAIKMLKKYRVRKEYQYGWGLYRVAVIDAVTLKAYGNTDGIELARMVRNWAVEKDGERGNEDGCRFDCSD